MDYSLVTPDSEDSVKPSSIQDMDFHQKLHAMLARDDLADVICWLSHGRAFRIKVPSRFEKTACLEYFGHKRYSSFLYQLGVHGYKQITTGTDRGAYYSPVRASTLASSNQTQFISLTCLLIIVFQLLLRGLPHVSTSLSSLSPMDRIRLIGAAQPLPFFRFVGLFRHLHS